MEDRNTKWRNSKRAGFSGGRRLIAVMASALMLTVEAPLWAQSQQQATPSNSSAQAADTNPLPDAPQPQQAQSEQQSTQPPSGAAAAKAPNVKGAPVAQPVGAAVAPRRPHSHRSLAIKLGLLAGAAVAVGAVVAMSAASPSRPPGAASSRP